MPTIQHSVTPEAGRYDFDGGCAPHSKPHGTYQNFSLGIFQWEPKAGARGAAGQVKRSKIFKHVYGQYASPQAAYDEARRLCVGYNNGTLTPPLKHAK